MLGSLLNSTYTEIWQLETSCWPRITSSRSVILDWPRICTRIQNTTRKQMWVLCSIQRKLDWYTMYILVLDETSLHYYMNVDHSVNLELLQFLWLIMLENCCWFRLCYHALIRISYVYSYECVIVIFTLFIFALLISGSSSCEVDGCGISHPQTVHHQEWCVSKPLSTCIPEICVCTHH